MNNENTPAFPLVERSVVSLMLRDDRWRRAAYGEGINADHFVEYGPVFAAIVQLERDGSPIDPEMVSAFLIRSDQILPFGGSQGIADLATHPCNPENWSRWIETLREGWALRVARDAAQWLTDALDSKSAMAAVKVASAGILQALAGPSKAKTAKLATAEFIEHLKALQQSGEFPGLPTGLPELDLISGGMRAGELWTATGKTSRGKTVLMMQIAAAAFMASRRTAIFSAEMLSHELIGRLASNVGSIEMDKLTKPNKITRETLAKIRVALENISEKSFWVDDSPGMSLEHVEGESQRLADEGGPLDLIVVDYIQILQGYRNKGENREQQVARISSGLKQLAKKMRCPVLTAAQLNQAGDARESQSIAFDSDALLTITEDGIKVLKLRNGRRDDVLPYRLNGELQRFEKFTPDPEPKDDPEPPRRGRHGGRYGR